MSADDQMQRFLAQLESEGETVAAGAFTLAEEEAVKKLAAFRMADPHMWVLVFVQAGNLLGASSVDFQLGRDSYASLRDVDVPVALVDGFFGRVLDARGAVEGLSPSQAAALRLLARACASTFAADAKHVRMSVSSSEGRVVIDMAGQDQVLVGRIDGPHAPEVHITVQREGSGRSAGRREAAFVSKHAAFSGSQVTTNNGRDDLGRIDALCPVDGARWRELRLRDGTIAGRLGRLDARRFSPTAWGGKIWFLQHGVLTEFVELPGATDATAIVDLPLETDLSGFSVRRDATFDAIVEAASDLVEVAGVETGSAEEAGKEHEEGSAAAGVVGAVALVVALVATVLAYGAAG